MDSNPFHSIEKTHMQNADMQAHTHAHTQGAGGGNRLTLTQAPVVVSHTVRMEMFWARFNHRTHVLVLLIHFTMVT